LDVIVAAAWLNDAARVYPVVIDPVVTGAASTWSGGIVSSCTAPSFGAATINVIIPANLTVTNFYVSASYIADSSTATWLSDGYMYFTTLCGRDPSNTFFYWTAMSPAGDYSGQATLMLQDMGFNLAYCTPPSCGPQTMALTMQLGRTYGPGGCNSNYIYHDPSRGYPFQAYIKGRAVELAGGVGSWSVSPASSCSNVCTASLSATVSGGVPPYTMTHPWASSSITFGSHTANSAISSGSASLTLDIPGCPGTCGNAVNLAVPPPIIVDACGMNIDSLSTKNILRKPVPVVTSTPLSTGVCSGALVSITNASCVAGSVITWTGSDGSSGTGNVTDHPVNGSASPVTVNYTVNVSANGCAGTPVIVPVTIHAPPAISVNPPAPFLCNGQSVLLTAGGAATYLWTPAGGLSATTGASITANPGSTTIYNVTGTDANGCTNTSNVTVALRTPPTITVTPTSATVCSGQSASLTASGASTYTWTPSAALSLSTGATVIARPPSTYVYTVTGTDSNGCSSYTNVMVNVNANPVLAISASSSSVCSGQSVSLAATGGNTYSWSPSTGLSSATGDSVSASPASTITYTVTGTNAAGCSSTATTVISVNTPFATAGQADTTICAGSAVPLNASGGAMYSWSPSTNLTNPNVSNPVAMPLVTTTYTVTASTGNCNATATVTISTYPVLPAPNIIQTGNLLTCSTSPQYISYQWYFNSTPIQNATTNIYSATQDGNYNVVVQDIYGCSVSAGININIARVVDFNAESENSLVLYPNPAHDELTVSAAIHSTNTSISILDMLGKVVQQFKMNSIHYSEINIQDLAPGVYFLELQGSEEKWVRRFVKQ